MLLNERFKNPYKIGEYSTEGLKQDYVNGVDIFYHGTNKLNIYQSDSSRVFANKGNT